MAIEIPVWSYWLFCALATALILVNRSLLWDLLSPHSAQGSREKGYGIWVVAGWAATLLASGCYILLTHKSVPGYYHTGDLLLFSLLNGFLEQFMFILWFLLGCFLARRFGVSNSTQIFGLGFLSYALYSGAIHALFWINVLPEHQPSAFMPPILLLMSLLWMGLLWRYRAVPEIVAMHSVIDFLTVGHLHFPWFERIL